MTPFKLQIAVLLLAILNAQVSFGAASAVAQAQAPAQQAAQTSTVTTPAPEATPSVAADAPKCETLLEAYSNRKQIVITEGKTSLETNDKALMDQLLAAGLSTADIKDITAQQQLRNLMGSGALHDAVRMVLESKGIRTSEQILEALSMVKAYNLKSEEMVSFIDDVFNHLPGALPLFSLKNVKEVSKMRRYYNLEEDEYRDVSTLLNDHSEDNVKTIKRGILIALLAQTDDFANKVISFTSYRMRFRRWKWDIRPQPITIDNSAQLARAEQQRIQEALNKTQAEKDAIHKKFKDELQSIQNMRTSSNENIKYNYAMNFYDIIYSYNGVFDTDDLNYILDNIIYNLGWGHSDTTLKTFFSDFPGNWAKAFIYKDILTLLLAVRKVNTVNISVEELAKLEQHTLECIAQCGEFQNKKTEYRRDILHYASTYFRKLHKKIQ